MAEDTIRVLRVLEYVGPRSLVEKHLEKVLYGVKPLCAEGGTIRAATIGVTPDILGEAEAQEEKIYGA